MGYQSTASHHDSYLKINEKIEKVGLQLAEKEKQTNKTILSRSVLQNISLKLSKQQ